MSLGETAERTGKTRVMGKCSGYSSVVDSLFSLIVLQTHKNEAAAC